MITGDKARKRVIASNKGQDQKSLSNQKSLLEIIDKAEAWKIDPVVVKDATASNLRVIIKPAKEAIDLGHKERLEELLNQGDLAKFAAVPGQIVQARGKARELIEALAAWPGPSGEAGPSGKSDRPGEGR